MKYYKLIIPNVAMVAVIYGLSRYTYGLFVPYIRYDFSVSTSVVGLIASSSYISYMVFTLLVPFLISKFGPKFPLIFGGIMATVGMFVIGFSQSIIMVAIGVIIAGSSPGLSYPPVPEIVNHIIKKSKQAKALTIINCGTGIGVFIGGPLALIAGDNWKLAWVLLGIISFSVTCWNWYIIASIPVQSQNYKTTSKLQLNWLKDKNKRNLMLLTFLIGITTSVYWTYAVDFIVDTGGFTTYESQIFWIIMGISGVLGAFGGHFIEMLGINKSLLINILGLGISLGLLAIFPSTWIGIALSAIIFGTFFIMITGIFAVWSVNIFTDQPSVGYSLVFFLITCGQFIGPSFMGFIANEINMTTTFIISAIMTALTGVFLISKPEK
ncbi:hypothetical protein AST04_08395 [Staphylococcus equorum]|nr:MFS transporter [Staphylococcus equorum]OEL08342.1 hypothetical protein AST04_08395 [Staphylococcus equorum]